MSRQIWIVECGRTTFEEIAALHDRVHARCVAGEIPDVLLLAELEPVFTAGPGAVWVGDTQATSTRRAGGVTYMGPGQLVAVPVIAVGHAREYVENLDHAVVATLADLGVRASRREPAGVWVGDEKIASLGLHVDRGFPREGGIAVLVGGDQSAFESIAPCGGPPHVTSLADEGVDISVEDFGRRLAQHVAEEFGAEAVMRPVQMLGLSTS